MNYFFIKCIHFLTVYLNFDHNIKISVAAKNISPILIANKNIYCR